MLFNEFKIIQTTYGWIIQRKRDMRLLLRNNVWGFYITPVAEAGWVGYFESEEAATKALERTRNLERLCDKLLDALRDRGIEGMKLTLQGYIP